MGTNPVATVPYLTCTDAARAIEFYARALGAVEELRIPEPDGKVSHATLRIDGARLFVSDEYPPAIVSPQTLGGTTCTVVLEVPDADAVVARAEAAGARVTQPVKDDFDGTARVGKFYDPYGHHWIIFGQA